MAHDTGQAPVQTPPPTRGVRVLILGVLVLLLVPGLALISAAVNRAVAPAAAEGVRTNVLATSSDECVACHRNTTPGIVEQYGVSSMAHANVTCQNCHVVSADYPEAVEHYDTYVLNSPTPARCEQCHQAEVAQFYQSRHALPAYVAFNGAQNLTEDQRAQYLSIPEGGLAPNSPRAALHALEGPDITPFACETCHNVGTPRADGSVGRCQDCHQRHTFSLEQARKPETCNACHIGPDHPQWEIYFESGHGIVYSTSGHNWNWEAEPGTLSVVDMPAATCAICHMSGFGATGTTHDVGDRLSWFLAYPVSERRPAWTDNRVRMQSVCVECHNDNFITTFYDKADRGTEAVNSLVRQADALMVPLREAQLITNAPFDDPIEFTHYELWHHYGRTAKFGMWMNGADYTQWHGVYEMLSDLADLKKEGVDLLEEAGMEVPDMYFAPPVTSVLPAATPSLDQGAPPPEATSEATTEAATEATPEATALANPGG